MFTKLKNESYSLELTLCCMNRILKETVFSYYDEWVRMEIQPDIQITEEQLYIHGNRQGLRRVIQNVIKNGLDHGEKKISIVLERDQNQAVLRISNQVTHPEQININQDRKSTRLGKSPWDVCFNLSIHPTNQLLCNR